MAKGLGRLEAPDTRHLELYTLTADILPAEPQALVAGIDWPFSFDAGSITEKTGPNGRKEYWVGLSAIGAIRGGHAICVPPESLKDRRTWRLHYNQGEEGACGHFAVSRAQTLANRIMYNPWPGYAWAQLNDGIDSTPPEPGTTVRACLEYYRTLGGLTKRADAPDMKHGILSYHWAPDMATVYAALKSPSYEKRGAIPFLQSWGDTYPWLTWMPEEVWQEMLFRRNGEMACITDRPGS